MKYIFVTGGVVSGLGKGICAASLARLLIQRGYRVQNQKFDPYLNVDPGTMSPYQHGEVFVTDDGAETDLDLGHYERFTDVPLDASSSVSSGKVYWSVLTKERRGEYLGKTVQIVPHVINEIKSFIYTAEKKDIDISIVEIGGTVGDIESQPFLEAIRQVARDKGRENVVYIHVPLVVEIPGSGELKSKPVQHSVKELQSIGIQPDILVCRSEQKLTDHIKAKGFVADMHSCGHNISRIEAYIAGGWESWTPQPMNDTEKLFEEYGDKIIITVDLKLPLDMTDEQQRDCAKKFVETHCVPGKKLKVTVDTHLAAFEKELYKQSRLAYLSF